MVDNIWYPTVAIHMENMLMISCIGSKSETRFPFSIEVYLDSASKTTDFQCQGGGDSEAEQRWLVFNVSYKVTCWRKKVIIYDMVVRVKVMLRASKRCLEKPLSLIKGLLQGSALSQVQRTHANLRETGSASPNTASTSGSCLFLLARLYQTQCSLFITQVYNAASEVLKQTHR